MDRKTKIAKELTGKILGENPKNIYAKTNSEIEGGEYVKNTEGVKQAEGKKHSKGGIKVLLEQGDRILTDYSKIGTELSKILRRELDLKVSPRSTYSDVLDKYNKSIGLTTKIEEEEKVVKKILDQEDTRIDGVTRQLNLQALSGRLERIKQEKAPLMRKQDQIFEILFKAQEDRKDSEGLTKEESKEEFQEGGTKRKLYEQIFPDYYVPNNKLSRQATLGGATYGNTLKNQKDQALEFMSQNHSGAYNKNLKEEINHANVLGYQKQLDEELLGRQEDIKRLYPDQYDDYVSITKPHLFGDKATFNGFDSNLGTEVASKPYDVLNILPKDIYEELNKAGIRSVGDLRNNDKYADYYNEYANGLNDSWVLGNKDQEEALKDLSREQQVNWGNIDNINLNLPNYSKKGEDTQYDNKIGNDGESDNEEDINPWAEGAQVLDFLPSANILRPSSIVPTTKVQNYLEQIKQARASAEQGLGEIRNRTETAKRSLEGLDPQTRAMMNLMIQKQENDAVGKLTSNVEDTNAKILDQETRMNLNLRDQFQGRQNQSDKVYEKEMMQAFGNFDKSRRRYYKDLAIQNRSKWDAIHSLNANNAMNTDVQFVNGKFKVRPGRLDIQQQINDYLSSDEGKKLLNKNKKGE